QLPLSVILFDLDHFKKVNDTYGHAVGDAVLRRVVQVARAELRSSDVIGRYGGEEFVVIMPMTSAQQAYQLAERIRAAVESLRVPTQKGDVAVTVSLGIAELLRLPYMPNGEAESLDDLVRRADEAMYAAKNSGRNRIIVFNRE
ncbi:MAG: GGDEF domain-containing protein, partial [Anaerolineales bacterium]|nr:GGDEF domain-containing protein [Anaerolineales bacterium]